MAFAGNRSELMKKVDVSSGFLEILLDREIITLQHYQAVKVFHVLSLWYSVYVTSFMYLYLRNPATYKFVR